METLYRRARGIHHVSRICGTPAVSQVEYLCHVLRLRIRGPMESECGAVCCVWGGGGEGGAAAWCVWFLSRSMCSQHHDVLVFW